MSQQSETDKDAQLVAVVEYLHQLYLSGIRVLNLTTDDDEILAVYLVMDKDKAQSS